MTTYVYEARDGSRIEREYRIGRYPRSVRHGGKRYEITICAPAMKVENVAGLHSGPPGLPVPIRNMHDIREIEARCPGLKYNPEYYHEHDPRRDA